MNKIIYIYDNRFTDLATAKALLEGTQIVYSLASPGSSPCASANLELFKGINNISTNAGKVEVTYRQDIYTTLNKKIEALQALMSNS